MGGITASGAFEHWGISGWERAGREWNTRGRCDDRYCQWWRLVEKSGLYVDALRQIGPDRMETFIWRLVAAGRMAMIDACSADITFV